MGNFLHNLVQFCHPFCCFFLLLFSCVYGAGELADHQHAVEMKSLLSGSCSASSKGLQIAHRDGPCSPFGQKNRRLTSGEVRLQDQSRVYSLNSVSSRKLSSDDFGFGTKLSLSKRSNIAKGNFVLTIGFGTPKRDLTVMFDTGSSTTWIQCLPCPNCYKQQEPIFDPSKSSTFSNASCSTSPCTYSQVYRDNSYSKGFYALDTLTFSSDVIPNFAFGCGQNNSNDFGEVAGVLGLGQGYTSLMSQTPVRMFCYCLPSSESSTGYLVLGDQASRTCMPLTYIPLLPDQTGSNRYLVNLVGITIGTKRLEMSANAASSWPLSSIIDSGTVISQLPPSVYSELRSSFQELMSNYPLAASKDELLDTCYNLEGYDPKNIIPSMILHFEDSNDLSLDYSAVVWQESVSQVCLAFAGNKGSNDLTIIGNHQQTNKKIYYDVLGKSVGFSAGDCGN